MKESKYIAAIRKWWEVAYALKGDELFEKLAGTVVGDTPWVKNPSQFRSEAGLGDVPRMILIRDFARKSRDLKWFYDELYGLDRKTKLLPGRHEFEGAMRLNSENDLPRKFYQPGVAEMLVTLIEKAAGRRSSAINASELFSKEFTGSGAIDNYVRWLSSGARTDAFIGQSELPKFVCNQERKGVIENLRRLILPKPGSPMVVNLYQKGMWEGLRSIVPEIAKVRDTAQDPRAILHIPLTSYSEEFTAPGYLQILIYLDNFFSGMSMDLSNAARDVNPEIVIERVRLAMAKTPAIIIFDGYSDCTIGFPEIERAIADDFLLNLIKQLTAPPLGHLNSNDALKRFSENRILVLSDVETLAETNAHNLRIPFPDSGIMTSVIDLQKLQHRDEIKRLIGHPPFENIQSEAILHVLDAVFCVPGDKGAVQPDLRRTEREVRNALQGMATMGHGDRADTQLAAVVQVFLDRIFLRSPAQYWLLVLIASTPGGIREDTLRRLIAAAAKVTSNDFRPIEVFPSLGDPSSTIADLKQLCGRMLTDRKSDDFEPLRHAHAAEFPSEVAVEPSDTKQPSLYAIDFAIPEVRRTLLARIKPRELRRIQNFHRLLAEESLTQATISFRHDPDQNSIGSIRRLLGVLYHGFMSLPVSHSKLTKAKIRSVDFAMPIDPYQLWQWLYLFAYRRLIERPPSWRLTRYYGADALKQEILQVVEQPWRLWGRYPQALPYIQNASGKLTLLDGDEGNSKELALDLLIGRSQAAYSLGDLGTAEDALERAFEFAGNAPRSRLRLNKRKLDLAMLRQDNKEADEAIDELQSLLGQTAKDAIDTLVGSVSKKLIETAGPGNFAPLVHVPPAAPVIEVLTSGGKGKRWGPSELSEISDVLFRIGERSALIGDIDYSEATIRLLKEGSERREYAEQAFLGHLTTSMAYFRLAEALRLRVFSDSPSSEHFFASGHSARQFVRVALKLERYSREQMNEGWVPVPGFFARKARQMSDVVTRHLYQYPRERASLLILESTMARLISGGDPKVASLARARSFLQRAEPVVLALGPGTRVRMRFLLERIKVHRRMAVLPETVEPAFALRCAEVDLATLGELVKRNELPLWKALFEIQKEAVARVRADGTVEEYI